MSDVVELRGGGKHVGHEHECSLPDPALAADGTVVMCRSCRKVWRFHEDTYNYMHGVWRRVRWRAWWYRLDAPREAPARWIAPRGGGYRPGGDLASAPDRPSTAPRGGGGVTRR